MIDTQTIDIQRIAESKINKVDFNDLGFGKVFSDHMLVAEYRDGKWGQAVIKPHGPISIPPSLAGLQYGQSIFEGLKAYRNEAGAAVIFRPEANLERLNISADRMCMPAIPESIFLEGLARLVELDQAWIPKNPEDALYIRPTMFAIDENLGVKPSSSYLFIIMTCPVGAYFSDPVKLKIETEYTRSCPGGTGFAKAAGNYAASMRPAQLAQAQGFNQVIWTDAQTHSFIEESGAMNVMFVIDGKLITPPTTDTILKGITRNSILQVAKDLGIPVEERPVPVNEVIDAAKAGRLQEAFGVGTAATISPVAQITLSDANYELSDAGSWPVAKQIRERLDAIKQGRVADTHGWVYKV